MENQSQQTSRLLELASAQCNGQLDDAGMAELESLLATREARRVYLRYIYLHTHLALSETAIRSTLDADELQTLTTAARRDEILLDLPAVSLASMVRQGRRPRHALRRFLLVSIAAILVLAPFLLVLSFVSPPSEPRIAGTGSIATVTRTSNARWEGIDALTPGQQLWPGTLRLSEGQATLRIGDGAQVAFAGPTMFGIESESTASLFSGKVVARVDAKQNEQFVLQARGVRVIDRGTEFGIDVEPNGVTEVHCFEGAIETLSRVRTPAYYWSFDEEEGPPLEEFEQQAAHVGPGTKRVAGLVGRGALSFDNTRAAFVNVGNGGGTRLGAGRFGVSSGITIELLTVVRWSGDGDSTGKPRDYDELFRKEDGINRLLLCFQNDDGARQRTIPTRKELGPTLSFGLNLASDGYSELEVPLDGREGRPSLDELRDGKPHHIVATYDSWTGMKSLYIDGRLCQQAKFPDGTLIISGGPTDAIIGNVAGGYEPYSGEIDEVAIYNFALTPEEIAEHWRQASAGRNYVGGDSPDAMEQELWKNVTRLNAGEAMRFDSETGMALQLIPLDKLRFRQQVAVH